MSRADIFRKALELEDEVKTIRSQTIEEIIKFAEEWYHEVALKNSAAELIAALKEKFGNS